VTFEPIDNLYKWSRALHVSKNTSKITDAAQYSAERVREFDEGALKFIKEEFKITSCREE